MLTQIIVYLMQKLLIGTRKSAYTMVYTLWLFTSLILATFSINIIFSTIIIKNINQICIIFPILSLFATERFNFDTSVPEFITSLTTV